MSFLTLPIEDAKEKTAAPEGEYDLRIFKISVDKTKKLPARDMITMLIEFVGHGHEYNPIRENIVMPSPGDTDRAASAALQMARIGTACGLRLTNTFNPMDLQGREMRCLVRQRENSETGYTENSIQWPRLHV